MEAEKQRQVEQVLLRQRAQAELAERTQAREREEQQIMQRAIAEDAANQRKAEEARAREKALNENQSADTTNEAASHAPEQSNTMPPPPPPPTPKPALQTLTPPLRSVALAPPSTSTDSIPDYILQARIPYTEAELAELMQAEDLFQDAEDWGGENEIDSNMEIGYAVRRSKL